MARPSNLERVMTALNEEPGKKLQWTAVADLLGWDERETKAWLTQMRADNVFSVGKTTWQVTKKRKRRDQVADQLELPFPVVPDANCPPDRLYTIQHVTSVPQTTIVAPRGLVVFVDEDPRGNQEPEPVPVSITEVQGV